MLCWCKDGRVGAGLSKNHSDMIFSANRWPESRRSGCAEKPLEPAVVQTSQYAPIWTLLSPASLTFAV